MDIRATLKGLYLVIIISGLLLTGCGDRPTDVANVDALPAIYPDYVGVTVPVGIAPLNFSMADDSVTTIDVEVQGSKAGQLHANGDFADFDIGDWHRLLLANQGGHLEFSVCAKRDGCWSRYRTFRIYVSQEPLSDWGITYRRVAPGYGMYSQMGIYQRDLSCFDETPLLVNTQIGDQCINCHTPNRANPDQYTFHVRGSNGATVIHNSRFAVQKSKLELLASRNDSLGGSMVYPYWHPGGRYCAYSTNATGQFFHLAKNKRIEVYDSSSDVFVFDTQTNTVLRDTLIMTTGWAENTPAFSPDGKWLYFTTALRQAYPTGYDQEKYSLCRVGFDEKTGRIGVSREEAEDRSRVDTLINTRETGKSASWPRPSYDGRYLMYTQTDYGYFTIWHPEADLWLLDLQTGETRPLTEVNSDRAESFHNWSTNSRWFLFTTRRENGLYTQVYFSHIDSQGKATKPFLLPQRNPKQYYRRSLYSYNTPDFTVRPVKTSSRSLASRIESLERVATKVENK